MMLSFLSYSANIIAQEAETAKPLMDTEVVRRVALLDLEGKY